MLRMASSIEAAFFLQCWESCAGKTSIDNKFREQSRSVWPGVHSAHFLTGYLFLISTWQLWHPRNFAQSWSYRLPHLISSVGQQICIPVFAKAFVAASVSLGLTMRCVLVAFAKYP